jgi:hypothetical protein
MRRERIRSNHLLATAERTTPPAQLAAGSALVMSSTVLVVQLAMERARVRREAAAKLPTCKWQMADGQSYVCFLSHYKV